MMENRIASLERAVESVKSDMVQRSDLVPLMHRLEGFDSIAVELKENNKLITRILQDNAKNEEAQKHQDKEIDRINKYIDSHGVDIRNLKEAAAANKPYIEMRTFAVRTIIGLLVAGVFGAAFIISK